MNAKYKILTVMVLLVLAGLACGQLNIGIEKPAENTVNENTGEVVNVPETDGSAIQETPREAESTPMFAQYWKVVADTRTGIRFAIPCFWEAIIPTPAQDPTGLGSFAVTNYTQAFIDSLGFKSNDLIWGIGGAKFDLGYVKPSQYGLSATANLQDTASALYANNLDGQIAALTPMVINGQSAIQVDTTSAMWGPGRFYLFELGVDLILMVSPYPFESDAHPDFQAILQSFSVSADREVQMPDQMPSSPPQGMGASCLGIAAADPADSPSTADLVGVLDCNTVTDEDPLAWLVCNVQAVFISLNTQPLQGMMGNEFLIGYWQSEGRFLTKDQAMEEIRTSLISPNPGNLTFTTDRTLFPPLFGMQPEDMFSPEANIVEVVYSEGGVQDGNGAAILVFSEDQYGDPYFYGMVVSGTHFDK